ncbi:MAG: radical SAM protein [Polyangiaceae bacterium]|nr:radical SAM protein [Polyangiaceae bacterium]
MKALIKVGYACNENCTFCHTLDLREQNDDSDRVVWKIRRAKALGYSMVVLSGGEPTIRPELLTWAKLVASLGLDFGLVTNGLLLSYPHVTSELIENCRLRYVYMSIHGGDAKVHRSVVRADTFDQAYRALELLAGRVPDLTANCVVTNANLPHLRAVVEKLLPLKQLAIKFSMTQPKGGGKHAFDVIVPDVEECAAAVKQAISHGEMLRGSEEWPRFVHDGIPFCLLPGLHENYDDLKTHQFATMIESDEDDFVPVDDVAKTHPPECDGCSLKGPCPGLFRGYLESRGASALRPVRQKPRSSSFNYVPERDIARPKGAPCPIKTDGVSPYDRARTLFVRMSDRMRLFRTFSRDFSDEEMLHIKEGVGQVYLDISTKVSIDDFSKDLRKLVLSSECRRCEKRPQCTGSWEPLKEDLFTRDDHALRTLVGSLTGRILDLGAGEGPYLDILAPKIASGEVDYVAVEPDAGRLELILARAPKARVLNTTAERLPPDIGTFDNVLCLRAYNHFADPQKALEPAILLLRNKGSLIVADNIAFGLLRTKTQANRAENAPNNVFEHYRNDGAVEAEKALSGFPLKLRQKMETGPFSSNQWLLCYDRV